MERQKYQEAEDSWTDCVLLFNLKFVRNRTGTCKTLAFRQSQKNKNSPMEPILMSVIHFGGAAGQGAQTRSSCCINVSRQKQTRERNTEAISVGKKLRRIGEKGRREMEKMISKMGHGAVGEVKSEI